MNPIDISIRLTTGRDVESRIEDLEWLCARIFERHHPDKIRKRYQKYRDWALHEAFAADRQCVVAFKLGHRTKADAFYSWLGGVDPDWRRMGIATALMRAQHDWARSAGYDRITTRTEKGNARMHAVNIAAGFIEAGQLTKPDGRILRTFEKSLA